MQHIDDELRQVVKENVFFLKSLLGAMLVIILLWDVRKHIIPNKVLIVTLIIQIITFLVLNADKQGIDNFLDATKRVLIIFLFFIFLYFFFSIGAIGAGDLKLFMIIGLGFKRPQIFILVTLMLASIQSLIQMIRKKNFILRIKYLINYIANLLNSGEVRSYIPRDTIATDKKEYSVHLSISALISWALCEGYLFLEATRGGI